MQQPLKVKSHCWFAFRHSAEVLFVEKIKVRGIVIREYEAGESDKRLTVFCKEHGRLMVYARGARKPTSKFLSVAQMFTYADFVLTKGRGFYSLAQADIIESFYPLREDYDRLMAAYQVAEVCEKTLWDNLESDKLLLLLLRALSVLVKGDLPPTQISSVFLLRFFDVFGLRPQAEACVICNAGVESGAFLCAEGLVCRSHKPARSILMSAGAVSALRFALDSELKESFFFAASDNVIVELTKAALLLWESHFEWKLKSL